MIIEQYIENVNNHFKSRIAGEHTYRSDLETLIKQLVKGVNVTNEPLNVTDCGNPDYVITKGKIPVGYIEAKDIGKDLYSKSYNEQFTRYKKELGNLIITDYLWFQFFLDEELIDEIRIGKVNNGFVEPIPESFSKFHNLIQDFCSYIGQTIKSSRRLAEMMALKASSLQGTIEEALTSDEETLDNSSLKSQFNIFKTALIHDLTPKGFADIYAQTLAYGMFAARLNDTTLDDFTRQEAAELIPKSNPLLRKLFGYIAGPDIDERIKTKVNALADVFRATDVDALLRNFGKSIHVNDPIIHFYETFLAKYDPKLRKAKGVWYTPEPVVKFIVRAVDDILKTDFGFQEGISDRSRITIKVPAQDKKKPVPKIVHKVQILDPATGTGTFLIEVVKQIYKRFQNQQGSWNTYVEEHLIPRLNGFEILMASYSMAHLKLDMLLRETGYVNKKNKRFNIYLTNSLEEFSSKIPDMFMQVLAEESTRANEIKRDTPVMCVIGNPPYAVSSSNKGEWIQSLIRDYKKDLNERKINLDDDYIKFIRYGQYYIDKNGEGILAFITNNSFIDGVTHRQMRKNLLGSFDKIYILDLHGNAKKKEVCPNGSVDQNVFDIMQGVSINIFVKTGNKKKKELGKVYHSEIFGRRDIKYSFLNENMISSIKWDKLFYKKPNYFFVHRNYDKEDKYTKGFKINTIFVNQNSGIQTKKDFLTINIDKEKLRLVVRDFQELDEQELKAKFNLKDTSGWTVKKAKEDIVQNKGSYYPIYYRPFDVRYIYMTEKSGGFVGRPRLSTMKHFTKGNNYGLITVRQQSTFDFQHILISNTIMESGAISLQTKEWGYIFPLYLYSDQETKEIFKVEDRKPNLNTEVVGQFASKLELKFTNEKEDTIGTFAPIDILDYIYAVLHSPTYRNKYKEFLKIDFPRVPCPKDKNTFLQLVKLGSEIRQIHLLESPKVEDYITTYPKDGSNTITTKVAKKDWELFDEEKQLGRIWINEEQYFDKLPLVAWEFYIGGYQPAQKWLKDRRGRVLNYDEINHYQKIIVALYETDRIMKEIDNIDIE